GGSVGERRPVAANGAEERVRQVWVRAAMAAALHERQVLGVLDRRRLGELADRLRQELCKVRHLDPLRYLGFRLLDRVYDRVFLLYLLPFEALLAAGHVEALAILPGDVEQRTRDLGHH